MKILIVDDNFEWIQFHIYLLNELLEERSCEIDYELSARAGFSRVIKNHQKCYDLIISDLEMEEILQETYAGAWFVRNIIKREECKNSKILIISGSYDIKDIAKSLDVNFIPKFILSENPSILRYKLEEMNFFN